MAREKPETRSYTSSLRSRQQEATRQLILEGLAALVAEGRIHTFTVQDVADRAGISYASVYRHFPTRETLLEAAYEWGAEVAARQMPALPQTLDDVPAWIEASIRVFEENADIGQAMIVVMAALNVNPKSQQQRDRAIEELVAEGAPTMSQAEVRRSAAVIRYLAGAQAWASLRRRFGLDPTETTAALKWALMALIRDIKTHRAGNDSEK